jgi:hypothetical protein
MYKSQNLALDSAGEIMYAGRGIEMPRVGFPDFYWSFRIYLTTPPTNANPGPLSALSPGSAREA